MKNKFFNGTIIILSFVFLIYFILTKNGIVTFQVILRTIKVQWLLVAGFLMILYWLFETLIIHNLTLYLYPKQKPIQSLKAAMVGQFFSSFTPYQTGAQPSLFYMLTGEGIDAGTASSILMMKFVIHQSVLTLYSFIIIVLKFGYFNSMMPNLLYICILGFLFNTGIILAALMFSINKKVTRVFLFGILKLLHKVRIVKDVNKFEVRIEDILKDFHDNAELIAKNFMVLFKVIFINTFQLTVFYIIPYCIYRSFNLNEVSLWNMLAAQTFVMMIVSMIPSPGGIGGAETSFVLLFNMFFKGEVYPALFLWRIISFYSVIVIGGLFTLLLPNRKDEKIKV
ncbi:MAG TPA: lysylphosphatidylglycerol synthase transmembrane domain-containing protein [Clostridiaceae bacterium]